MPIDVTSTAKEEDYLLARKSLKMWPVFGDNLAMSAVDFMEEKLGMRRGRINPEDVSVVELPAPVGPPAQHQVLVNFRTVRTRDEIKTLGKNLRGESNVGIQMEVPDFLRGRFQTFQSLAFQMKKKNPTLKRNIKFVNSAMDLVMDIKLNQDSDWKTIQYEDASAVLPAARRRDPSMTIQELASTVESPVSPAKDNNEQTSSDMDDDTLIDITDDENTVPKNYSSHSLSFVNTNARSLGPKLDSFFDCMHEKGADLGFVTETWYQSNRENNESLENTRSDLPLQ